mmetsp:Transcript_31082/g.29918  ORF Transcript_31082/g.29918 Transcript_31082/m.29918 type:complete len:207 (-) Transcript_31082:62-682(-)|eukprot:CAMPEP_0197835674 /NCGR_PEP_ID=MMETSP1437-20131217/26610_1 /TAXON_ID=49252 ORGANISM="Eucampia antarctica, Strain CCMP1452" /NCGR_SAMPLE_ID=MMETSP1437 /ASSEMBLY_ACC=CAM_ASM_001096 /LENGTH=206 /DNA_ID=CAMNT_0043441293 /DNA_START=109 /DNA_END=729 /DNA_ORIENTATION=+
MVSFQRFTSSIVVICVSLVLSNTVVATTTEPRTGISFPNNLQGSPLSKLGVRTKGPIKVYAVGQYDDDTFVLQMSYGIGSQKMSSALVDALKPRCNDEKAIEEFEDLMMAGLPDGAKKGTKLTFVTGGGKLSLTVNNNNVGKVSSKSLATAFPKVYTDDNAVCQLNSVGEGNNDDGTAPPRLSFFSPRNCALAGASVGYGIGKLFS